MNNMLLVTVLFGLIIIGAILIIRNLLLKVERYEDDILMKDEYIKKVGDLVDESYKKIKDLDIRGAFEADDEVGTFFETLKEVTLLIKTYTQNYSK
jgi:hypothetical protein